MGQVFFALGVARATPDDGVPGTALISLLSDLGLSESAARAAILRLRRHGWLSSTRHGRQTHYAPAPAILSHQQRLRDHFIAPTPPWEGAFHGLLYEIPERDRAFRDRLRRSARLLGYAPLRAGLLVAPTDRSAQLQPLLRNPPPKARLLPLSIKLAQRDSRRLARDLWALDALADDYRTHTEALRRAVLKAERSPLAGPRALRAFAAAMQPIYQAIANDPLVPQELLPADWPAPELSAAFQTALQTFAPPAIAYADNLKHHSAAS